MQILFCIDVCLGLMMYLLLNYLVSYFNCQKLFEPGHMQICPRCNEIFGPREYPNQYIFGHHFTDLANQKP